MLTNKPIRNLIRAAFSDCLGKMIWLGLAVAVCWGSAWAQNNGPHVPSDNRGDPTFRRKSNIDGNNVRATVFNFGFSGRTSGVPDEIAYEWPKNTRRIYIALVAIWLAGEVQDENGQIIQVVDFPTFRNSPAGASWNMEPVPGFLNPNHPGKQLARSDDPTSWPTVAQGGWRDKSDDPVDPGWIGSWNGFFGKNIFNADQEMFYRCSDDLYSRPLYVPDETDPARGGLGLLMDVRAFAWSQILINDVVFFIHDILNDGTKRISKTSFLIWLADIVGNDAQDDEPFVDLQTSIAFLTDADRVGLGAEWQGVPVGVASVKFLETPGNQVDGIDNEGDVDEYPELLSQITDANAKVPLFTDADFNPRNLAPGDKVILIDSLTFERRIIAYPQGGGQVKSLGPIYNLPPQGVTLVEDTTANLLDDDLDGTIDERLTLHLERFDEISGTVQPVRHINYLFFAVGDTVKRGFLVAGKTAAPNYTNLAPMVDESRDDGFDNDNDWSSLQDDVGLDGVKDTGDPGEGDGTPTSGTGTNFPGEPNIDKTDVSETDLIGLTSALQDPAFAINFNTVSDEFVWRKFMVPGRFYLPRPTGEYDGFVSSGFFPLEPGQRQRMAISVALAGGGIDKNADLESAEEKQRQARNAFESDYQFAQAPLQPTLTAVPGDGKVTLYWDEISENSIDRYIQRITGSDDAAKDFQGYRIYRATDAAFLDPLVITNAQGNPILRRPIAQFDKKDGIQGLHPVDIQGVKFDLGSDNGLVHSFIDSNVVNGQLYYYAVTAYDGGYVPVNISPTETFVQIDVDPQGNARLGQNVVAVRPEAPVAGYVRADVVGQKIQLVAGTTTALVTYDIVDPRSVLNDHVYEISFQDTVIKDRLGRGLDTLTTKSFTLTDATTGEVKIKESTQIKRGDETPLVDGFRLLFFNESRVQVNEPLSGWNHPEVFVYRFAPTSFLTFVGEQRPNDYAIIFGEVGTATSKDTTISSGTTSVRLPSKVVNFKVVNLNTGEPVAFAFAEIDGNDGRYTVNPTNANRTDIMYFLEPNAAGQLLYTWQNTIVPRVNGRNPQAGDTLEVYLRKPFLEPDLFRFTMRGESLERDLAKSSLDQIRVVPNPYVAAERWEPHNPYNTGRGPRELHFINLPQRCTIRIFDVNGVLVDTIEQNSTLDSGTAIWDMLSKDGLSISYGIYLFHIDAPDIGQKTGTFAVIK
jgi:hypothetical protein